MGVDSLYFLLRSLSGLESFHFKEVSGRVTRQHGTGRQRWNMRRQNVHFSSWPITTEMSPQLPETRSINVRRGVHATFRANRRVRLDRQWAEKPEYAFAAPPPPTENQFSYHYAGEAEAEEKEEAEEEAARRRHLERTHHHHDRRRHRHIDLITGERV